MKVLEADFVGGMAGEVWGTLAANPASQTGDYYIVIRESSGAITLVGLRPRNGRNSQNATLPDFSGGSA